MADDLPTAAPDPVAIAIGDRVTVMGEIRKVGEDGGYLVRFRSAYDVLQYVWVRRVDFMPAPPLAP